ncbi:helix-turn-helix domain-containing protein [Lysobacter tyrosinilyticus]
MSLRIRRARRLALVSQNELARRVGVNRSAVAQWESANSTTCPSVGHLIHLAVETGVNFEWLATGRGDSGHSRLGEASAVVVTDLAQDKEEGEALRLLRSLSNAKRTLALQILELLAD